MGRKNIKMNGLAVTVSGRDLQPGDAAPEFVLYDNSLKPVKRSDYAGKTLIISCVPSLDTPTCDLETRRFNTEASKLSGNIRVLTVSRDLPFAQTRWCAANGVDKVVTLSDYRHTGFAEAYGVLLEDLGLLTRALFVVDKEGVIRYIQFVEEVTKEPDYNAVLAAASNYL